MKSNNFPVREHQAIQEARPRRDANRRAADKSGNVRFVSLGVDRGADWPGFPDLGPGVEGDRLGHSAAQLRVGRIDPGVQHGVDVEPTAAGG